MPDIGAKEYEKVISGFTQRFLGRGIRVTDGVSAREMDAAEARLGVRWPAALRYYHDVLGNCAALNSAHNELLWPPDVHVEDGYLMFMEENQSVVSWGIKVEELGEDDPIVWQRNNTPPTEWHSEGRSFSALMSSMFEWYQSEGMFEDLDDDDDDDDDDED